MSGPVDSELTLPSHRDVFAFVQSQMTALCNHDALFYTQARPRSYSIRTNHDTRYLPYNSATPGSTDFDNSQKQERRPNKRYHTTCSSFKRLTGPTSLPSSLRAFDMFSIGALLGLAAIAAAALTPSMSTASEPIYSFTNVTYTYAPISGVQPQAPYPLANATSSIAHDTSIAASAGSVYANTAPTGFFTTWTVSSAGASASTG